MARMTRPGDLGPDAVGTGSRPKIHILGGGMGSLTAALFLSEGRWREHFSEIVIYESTPVLGGKCASHRDVETGRVYEHGLHVWFGFYENSFRMLRHCHNELDALIYQRESDGSIRKEPRWSPAMTRVEQGFRPIDTVTLMDDGGAGWQPWTVSFPSHGSRPWDRDINEEPAEWNVALYLSRLLNLGAAVVHSAFPDLKALPSSLLFPGRPDASRISDWASHLAPHFSPLEGAVPPWDVLDLIGQAVADAARAAEHEGDTKALVQAVVNIGIRVLDRFTSAVRLRADDVIRQDDDLRRAWYVIDLILAVAKGLMADGLLLANDLDKVDHLDFCDWLRRQGAMEESVTCTIVRALVYDLGFAYENGDPYQPRCGAGTALRGLFRALLTYRGSILWKANGGMGDIVIAPIYELLCKRGVEVRFNHRVTEVHLDSAIPPHPGERPRFITAFDVCAPLVDQPSGKDRLHEWELLPVGQGDPMRGTILVDSEYRFGPGSMCCWTEGDNNDGSPAQTRREELRPGDVVVCGISIGALAAITGQLSEASETWAAMIENVKTVSTQSVQLWLKDLPYRSSATEDTGSFPPDVLLGGFLEPYDTWSDMPILSGNEVRDGIKTVAYLCNVFPDKFDDGREEDKKAVAAEALEHFLNEDAALIWPGGDGEVLRGSQLSDRIRQSERFTRANYQGTERYVQSVPKSSKHRIKPDKTPFSNLLVVGDWTRCTLNAGCVEAAVISGMDAANALRDELGLTIIGQRDP